MRLLLVRHAETEANISGTIQGQMPGELTAQGLRQAQALAQRLRTEQLDLAFCSDLKRAVDTLQFLLDLNPALPVQYNSELRERSMGVLVGHPGNLYMQLLDDSKSDRINYRPQDGESILDLRDRAALYVDKLRQEHNDKSVLLLTHGGVITVVLSYLLDAGIEEMLERPFGNTSVSEILLEPGFGKPGKASVVRFNCVEHLTYA